MIYSLDNTDLTGCAHGEKLYMLDCPRYSEALLTAYHAFTSKMTNPRDGAGVREVFSARSAVPDSGRLHLSQLSAAVSRKLSKTP